MGVKGRDGRSSRGYRNRDSYRSRDRGRYRFVLNDYQIRFITIIFRSRSRSRDNRREYRHRSPSPYRRRSPSPYAKRERRSRS